VEQHGGGQGAGGGARHRVAASMPVRLSTATTLRPALRLAKGRSSASSALRPVLGRTCGAADWACGTLGSDPGGVLDAALQLALVAAVHMNQDRGLQASARIGLLRGPGTRTSTMRLTCLRKGRDSERYVASSQPAGRRLLRRAWPVFRSTSTYGPCAQPPPRGQDG